MVHPKNGGFFGLLIGCQTSLFKGDKLNIRSEAVVVKYANFPNFAGGILSIAESFLFQHCASIFFSSCDLNSAAPNVCLLQGISKTSYCV